MSMFCRHPPLVFFSGVSRKSEFAITDDMGNAVLSVFMQIIFSFTVVIAVVEMVKLL